jgi:hypothetical protein
LIAAAAEEYEAQARFSGGPIDALGAAMLGAA